MTAESGSGRSGSTQITAIATSPESSSHSSA
jgi:hypothetical protein